MRVRIKKKVLGDEWTFLFNIVPKSLHCTFRLLGQDEVRSATIDPTIKYILLDDPLMLSGYVNGPTIKAPQKIIKKIKLSTENSINIREYVE